MDLKAINGSGIWGTAAADINDNFSRTNIEVEKLKVATINHKGYFTDLPSLKAAVPSPKPGDSAWAGTPYPGTVYDCITAGTWRNTGAVPDTPSADLNNWIQTGW